MTLRTNTFEATGVTPGTTTVNATNSATSGDALSSLGTVIYSSAQAAHGTLSALCNNTSGGNAAVRYTLTAGTAAAARVYLYIVDSPTAATHVLRLGVATSDATVARLVLGTDRKLFLQDAAGATRWTATTPLGTGAWYRLELGAAIGATTSTGTLRADYYLADAVTPVETGYNSAAENTGTAVTVGFASAGKYNSTTWTSAVYVDDFAATDTTSTYVGPAVTTIAYVPTTDTGATTTGWALNPSGAAGFYSVLGDVDDATYAETGASPTGQVLQVPLPAVPVPKDLSTVSVSVRAAFNGATSGTVTAALYQNTTLIKTGTATALSAAMTDYVVPLTSTEAGGITATSGQWQNLAVRLTVSAS